MLKKDVDGICAQLVKLNRLRNQAINRIRHINQPAEQEFKSDIMRRMDPKKRKEAEEKQRQEYAEAKAKKQPLPQNSFSKKLYKQAADLRKKALKILDNLAKKGIDDEYEIEEVFQQHFEGNDLKIVIGRIADLQADQISLKAWWSRRDKLEADMTELVVQLGKIHEWWCSHKGCSSIGLAKLVGEAGNYVNYENPGKLWKRYGLAPFTYEGKTFSLSQWKKVGLPKEVWVELGGYCARRRSAVYTVGDPVIKNRGDYRKYYDQQREKKNGLSEEWTPKRCHQHAQRYMEKRMVRDLWIKWNEVVEGGHAYKPWPFSS